MARAGGACWLGVLGLQTEWPALPGRPRAGRPPGAPWPHPRSLGLPSLGPRIPRPPRSPSAGPPQRHRRHLAAAASHPTYTPPHRQAHSRTHPHRTSHSAPPLAPRPQCIRPRDRAAEQAPQQALHRGYMPGGVCVPVRPVRSRSHLSHIHTCVAPEGLSGDVQGRGRRTPECCSPVDSAPPLACRLACRLACWLQSSQFTAMTTRGGAANDDAWGDCGGGKEGRGGGGHSDGCCLPCLGSPCGTAAAAAAAASATAAAVPTVMTPPPRFKGTPHLTGRTARAEGTRARRPPSLGSWGTFKVQRAQRAQHQLLCCASAPRPPLAPAGIRWDGAPQPSPSP